MTLGLNSDQVVAITGVLTFCGGVITWVLKNKDAAQEAEIKAMKERFRELGNNLTTAWTKIDTLRDDRGLLWTRAEQERFETKIENTTKDLRSEIRTDLETLGTRLSSDLTNLGNRFDNTVRELMKGKING